jgi:hypothetical protein
METVHTIRIFFLTTRVSERSPGRPEISVSSQISGNSGTGREVESIILVVYADEGGEDLTEDILLIPQPI